MRAIRRLVVGAAHVERPDGVVRWTDQVDGIEPEARHLDRVPQRRGFGRRQILPKPMPQLESRRAQAVRRRRWRNGADDDGLRHADRGELLEQPRDRTGPVAHPVCFTPPEALDRKGHEVRIASPAAASTRPRSDRRCSRARHRRDRRPQTRRSRPGRGAVKSFRYGSRKRAPTTS